MINEEDDVLNGENSMFSNKYIKEVKQEFQLKEAKQLLKEAVEFMNLVPNNSITKDGDVVMLDLFNEEETIDHYKLCSKIDKFLRDEN